MHIFLSALAGLSITGAALAPALTNGTNEGAQNQVIVPQATSEEISFDGKQSISTNQSESVWEFKFDYHQGQTINRIEFLGGGLSAYVDWGSWNWSYSYSGVDIKQEEMTNWVTLFRHDHSSFLATQTGMLQYKLSRLQDMTYQLSLYLFTQSYNSLTSSTGNLNIGTGIRVITN